MPNNLKAPPEAGVLKLAGGIIADVHTLIGQQLALFRQEVREEVDQAEEAGVFMVAGSLALGVGGFMLAGMLVHLLAQTAPAVPLWGCYGIVGTPIAASGALLCYVGRRKFSNAKPTRREKVGKPKEQPNG